LLFVAASSQSLFKASDYS